MPHGATMPFDGQRYFLEVLQEIIAYFMVVAKTVLLMYIHVYIYVYLYISNNNYKKTIDQEISCLNSITEYPY